MTTGLGRWSFESHINSKSCKEFKQGLEEGSIHLGLSSRTNYNFKRYFYIVGEFNDSLVIDYCPFCGMKLVRQSIDDDD